MKKVNWNLETVAQQALVLYEGLREKAIADDDPRGHNCLALTSGLRLGTS